MTVLIKLPGTLTDTSGLRRVVTTLEGFPDDGLKSLYLFEDGAGTAPANAVEGGEAAAIESLVASNNGYEWLPGGGLRIQGGQIISMPALDLREPFTIVSAARVIGSVGDTTSVKNYSLIAFRTTLSSDFRGPHLYLNGGTDWNVPATPKYTHRTSNGAGGTAAAEDLLPSTGVDALNSLRIHVVSYNGADALTSSVYDKNVALIASDSRATSDALLTTGNGGVVVTHIKPIIGPYSSTFAGGNQQVEASATYDRPLSSDDIARICASASALAASPDRGRA